MRIAKARKYNKKTISGYSDTKNWQEKCYVTNICLILYKLTFAAFLSTIILGYYGYFNFKSMLKSRNDPTKVLLLETREKVTIVSSDNHTWCLVRNAQGETAVVSPKTGAGFLNSLKNPAPVLFVNLDNCYNEDD
jgi:hypothetical protein